MTAFSKATRGLRVARDVVRALLPRKNRAPLPPAVKVPPIPPPPPSKPRDDTTPTTRHGAFTHGRRGN